MIFDPARIERELSEIMVRNSPTEARASLLNLVVFSTPGSAAQADAMLQAVLGKRAARVIHITRTDEGESQVSVSARCYLDHSNRSVCLQEVVISDGRDGVGGAVATWAPLLIRDIPVYVVWLDRLGNAQREYEEIAEIADTLMYDSDAALRAGDDIGQLFARLAELARRHAVALCDITWRRVLPLCAVTADCFDAPQLQQQIESISSVTLTGMPAGFAALYLAWFATRAGLSSADNRGIRGTGERSTVGIHWNLTGHGNRTVSVSHRKARPIDEGAEVTIRFGDDGELTIRAMPGGCAEIETNSDTSLQVLPQPSDGEILLSEIDGMRRDHIYAETLASLDTFM